MTAFSTAFNQFFSFIAICFTALERLGKTADNLATVAEESSGQYKDAARIERAARLHKLKQEHREALEPPASTTLPAITG